ncbi:restriction endonuclease subunit S [Vibrio cholerae]|uniref:restriction endonuclease subunit S n=1 Tax=Vibrio cholerae TaxID=666 RepID=UPI0013C2C3B8|nr:restriction endonuclease subunit S [Vibrio cholerae]
MVPNGWSNTCIDDNITFSGGAQPPREVFKFEPEEGYIRLIQIRDYKSDKFITYVPKKLAKKFCTADDVMIGRYGPPIFQILRGIEGAYNVALIKAIPKSGVDKEFMYYFLKRDPLLKVIESFSQRTSGQTGIEMDVLKAYPMHLPPLPEQRKIAQILSTWDRGIATTEKLIDASKQQKKALMQQLLTGKKRLIDPETGEAFEGDWEEVKLGDVLTKISNGLTYDSKATQGLPVSRIETISTGKVNHAKVGYAPNDEKTIKFKLQFGDILYSHINSLEHIGRVAYFLDDKDLYHGMNLLLLRASKDADSKFIYFMLSSSLGKEFARSHAKSAVNQASISTTDLKGFKAKLPGLGEQQKIASVLTAADKEIELLQAKLAHFKDEKKALMQQLLTGKRRVKVEDVQAA